MSRRKKSTQHRASNRDGRRRSNRTRRSRIDEDLQRAVVEHRAGRLDAAATFYHAVLDIDPQNPDAHHLLGVAAHQGGDHKLAIQHISQAIRFNATTADYYLNLGSAQQATGHLEDAIASFEQSLQLHPNSAVAHNNLANALKQQGRTPESLEHYETALRLQPDYALAHCNYGAALTEIGNLEAAETSLQRALQIDPQRVEARSNLGIVQARRGQHDDAISSYLAALEQQPQLAETWSNLGNLLKEQGQIGEASTAYTHVSALRQQPIWEFRAGALCPVIMQSNAEIDQYRQQLECVIKQFEGVRMIAEPDQLSDSNCEPPFTISYHGRNDRPLKQAYAELFRESIPQFESADRDGPAHVAFIVADRREAVFVRFMRGILKHLASDQLKVTVVCSHAGHSALAKALGDKTFHVDLITIPQRLCLAAPAIAALAADILFFFEIGTDSFSYFLPFFQSAPVQCTSWGVPVTSGIPCMQYFISSDLLEPIGAEGHYSEQLIRLSTLPACFDRPQPPAQRKARGRWGLPDQQHLYLCPQSLFKFHPDFDDVLANVLRADPQGLLVLVEAGHPHWTRLLVQRIARSMPDVVERVVLVPRQSAEEFVGLLACCDAMLDPLHFGGGATTYEALALGTPIVTLPGEFMRGRVTTACYQKMGLMECVADSAEHYVSLAVKLGTVPDYRRELTSRILARNDVLYEDRQAVEELRTFFLEAAHAAR